MKHTIEDERTRGLKRQVRGEAYLLTAALLLVSLFWKTYGLGLPVTSCWWGWSTWRCGAPW